MNIAPFQAFIIASIFVVPCPNLYVKLNPIKLTVDTFTIQWFNSFALSLAKDVVSFKS